MAIEVLMPHMGESVAEGRILHWFKREGEPVRRDETLAEVETDKANVEIPAPQDGVLGKILAPEGHVAPVGAAIAVLEARLTAPAGAPLGRGAAQPVAVHPGSAPSAAAGPPRDHRLTITPVVAKVMERHGLTLEDVRNIRGSGDGGRVTKQDILAYAARRGGGAPAAAPPPPPPAGERAALAAEAHEVAGLDEPVEEIPLTGLRRAIAEHMVRSKHAAPHVTTVAEVDMTTLVEFRERHKGRFKEEGVALTYMPFFVKAVCAGLMAFPALNASMEGEKLLLRRYYHIGVAVETGAGLVVPVIRHADRASIRELAKALHRVAEGARARKLLAADLEGGTFTITNPGVFGGILSTPIIHQPQAAILGVQAIQKRPVVREDRIAIRSMMYLCLSYDHRIVDGATAVQFLQTVRRHLEDPLELFV